MHSIRFDAKIIFFVKKMKKIVKMVAFRGNSGSSDKDEGGDNASSMILLYGACNRTLLLAMGHWSSVLHRQSKF